jgi:hypothetical protein
MDPIYLHAHIRVVPGKLAPFLKFLAEELKPVMESYGWKLADSFLARTGPTNTVINIWEVASLAEMERVRSELGKHADAGRLAEMMETCVLEENLTVVKRLH